MVKKYHILLLLIFAGASFLEAQDNKKPATITYVKGAVNNTYSLVQTTIYNNPQSDPDKKIITRAQLDVLGPNKQSSKPLDIKLETPQPPTKIETYGAPQVASKIGELVGTVGGPKGAIAGKAIQGASAIAEIAVSVTEKELDKIYENQQIRVNLLEIIPTKYYTIDQSTGKINYTDDFLTDFAVYTDLLQKYLTAFEDYRKYENAFTQMSLKLRALDPSGKQTAAWENVRNYDATQVQPRLKVKNQLEDQLARMFPLYRIAIMASPSAPSNTCGAAGQGPWEVYIIYYLGAEQTNKIAVKYCVKNLQDFQNLQVEVVKNSIIQTDPKYNLQQFKPGGVSLQAQSNATFGQATGIGQSNFNATQTEVFNWFTDMVKSPAGASVESYLVPFNVYAIRQSLAQQAQETKDAAIQGLLNSIDGIIQAYPELAKQQAELAEQKKLEQQKELERKLDIQEILKLLGLDPTKGAQAHQILGVAENASPDEVNMAYKKLADKWNPDNFTDPIKKRNATQVMEVVNQAADFMRKKNIIHLLGLNPQKEEDRKAYKILGLKDENASLEEIDAAYKKLATVWNPEDFTDPIQRQNATYLMEVINEAADFMRKKVEEKFYKILGVDKNASLEQINAAYEKLISQARTLDTPDAIKRIGVLNEAVKIARENFEKRQAGGKFVLSTGTSSAPSAGSSEVTPG